LNTDTLHDVITRDLKSTRERFRVQPDDGLLIAAIKCFGGPYQLWHRCLMNCIVPVLALFIRRCIIPVFSFVAPLLGVAQNGADAKQFAKTFQSAEKKGVRSLFWVYLWGVLWFRGQGERRCS